jgi:hypothetical protein
VTNADFTSIGKVVVAILERGGEIRDRNKLIKLIKDGDKYGVWQADSVNSIYKNHSAQPDIMLALRDFISFLKEIRD